MAKSDEERLQGIEQSLKCLWSTIDCDYLKERIGYLEERVFDLERELDCDSHEGRSFAGRLKTIEDYLGF
mgnify:CR=1 FL=1|jgi:hypothetical protein